MRPRKLRQNDHCSALDILRMPWVPEPVTSAPPEGLTADQWEAILIRVAKRRYLKAQEAEAIFNSYARALFNLR
jgi:hypothetical protein